MNTDALVWACATELSRSFSQYQLTSKLATYTIQLTRLTLLNI